MSKWLTYANGKAFHLRRTFPDENYAREIMQLFTIGIWQLNDDGTQKLDSSGSLIPSYSNTDIATFARVWVGLNEVYRSNVGQRHIKEGHLDVSETLRLEPRNRDPYPKTKLDAGYVGDEYPLCSTLPSRQFLAKGARYRLTGFNLERTNERTNERSIKQTN